MNDNAQLQVICYSKEYNFYPVSDEMICEDMKKITLEDVERSLVRQHYFRLLLAIY